MTDKPQRWKNLDSRALSRAVRTCDQMAALLGDFIEVMDRMSPSRRAQVLGKMGTLLAIQRSALAEMERIRLEVKDGRAR